MGASDEGVQEGGGEMGIDVCVCVSKHVFEGVSQSSPVSEMCEGSVTEDLFFPALPVAQDGFVFSSRLKAKAVKDYELQNCAYFVNSM